MKRFTLLAVLLTAFCFITKADPTSYLSFNGDNQYVDIPTTDDLSMTTSESLTVSFWVKCTNYSSTPRVISNRYNMVDTNGAIDIFYGSSGCAIMFLYPDNSNTDPINNFLGGGTDGSWVHIVGVMDRTTGISYGYADGSLVYTGELHSGFYIQPTISTLLGVGRDTSGNYSYYLNGAIANVRYYKSALSADDVAADMAANSYAELSDDLKASCVAAYDLSNVISSFTLTDATGNGNNGTLVNYDLSVVLPERTITVESADDSMGTVTGGGTSTTDIVITATANAGFQFLNWTVDGVVVSTDATYFDTTEGDKTYVANFEEVYEYCTTDETTSGSNGRGLTSLTLAADGQSTTVSVNQGTTGTRAVYYDKTSTKVTVEAGSEVALSIDWTGYWMHGYLYVDYNKDVVFTPQLNGDGVPTADSELVSFTYYSSTEASYGVNSAGESTYYGEGMASDALPSFIIPESTPAGEYRARLNIDWCSIDPCGTGDMGANEGAMVDFVIVVETQTVVVSTETSGRGSVTINGEAVTSLDVEAGESVELQAVPEDGSSLLRWEVLENGAVVSTSEEEIFTIESIAAYTTVRAVFGYDMPRSIMVMSNDPTMGSAAITSPYTEYPTSILTGEDVTVLATPANDDVAFLNWTINDEVVSTDVEYTYTAADGVFLWANFAASYAVTVIQAEKGTLSATVNGDSYVNGTKVAAGTELVIKASPNNLRYLQQLLINGVNVIDQVVDNSYTLIVTETATVTAVFADIECYLTYENVGGGYIEIWSSEEYNEDDSSYPSGEQFTQNDIIPISTNVYIFPYEYDGELQSILVNGEERIYDITVDGYTSVEYYVEEPIHIEAIFTGTSTGVESAEADAASVYAVAGGVKVVSATSAAVEVYSITGSLIASEQLSGAKTIALSNGIYLVKVAGKVSKVIVK